jgi:hypothetical protein
MRFGNNIFDWTIAQREEINVPITRALSKTSLSSDERKR